MMQRQPTTIFLFYAFEDELLVEHFKKHLTGLQRQGLISVCNIEAIRAGENIQETIDKQLDSASIILLLISSDLLNLDDRYNVGLQRALDRHVAGTSRVIPIILRPVDWQLEVLQNLECLPLNKRAVTQWADPDLAFCTIVSELRHIIEPSANPAIPVDVPSSPNAAHTPRERVLNYVEQYWIKDLLEHSLYQKILLDLGLQKTSEGIMNPWRLEIWEMNHPPCPLSDGTRIANVYDSFDGQLLILGEPGSGKTTLLLELTRELIHRARQEKGTPIPVVLDLPSWAVRGLSLEKWLIQQLRTRYKISSRKTIKEWIKNNQLILLLDGLDEVPEAARSSCIAEIDRYRKAHDFTSIVTCCRGYEYWVQTKCLVPQHAIVIRPLTTPQIEVYLSKLQGRGETVRRIIYEDVGLREMVTTPLLLNLLLLIYDEKVVAPSPKSQNGVATPHLHSQFFSTGLQQPTKDLRQESNYLHRISNLATLRRHNERLAIQRRSIFTAYVKKMLKRRHIEQYYTDEQIIRWLSWLARSMKHLNQSTFYADLRLDTLPDFPTQMYHSTRLTNGCLMCALLVVAFFCLSVLCKLADLHGAVNFFDALRQVSQTPQDGIILLFTIWGVRFYNRSRETTLRNPRIAQYYYIAGFVPQSNYSHFLDFAVEHMLLRKMGKRYAFTHDLLRDYFASLDSLPISYGAEIPNAIVYKLTLK